MSNLDKSLEVLQDMFAAMQGDEAAKLRLKFWAGKVRVVNNTVFIKNDDGTESTSTVM